MRARAEITAKYARAYQRVWAFSGFECGRYLAVVMRTLPDALERHGS